MKYLFIVVAILFASCSSNVRFSSESVLNSSKVRESMNNSGNNSILKLGEKVSIGEKFNGKASYYADKYHGRMTANGEIFDMNKISAAHKTLPFGTKLLVTNLSNGKSVVVKINDRGPFISGRIIDLSKEAAKKIDMIKSGIAEVELEVIQ